MTVPIRFAGVALVTLASLLIATDVSTARQLHVTAVCQVSWSAE